MPIDPTPIARLARMELAPAELAAHGAQLERILKYIDQLKELKVDGVEPLAHAGDFHSVFRGDLPAAPLPSAEVLRNAPGRQGNFFTVPKVIE